MQNRVLFLLSAGVLLVLASCKLMNKQGDENPPAFMFNKDSLGQHIQVLASDSFGGRKPFSAGETKTVAYMQNTFARLGLEPGNGNSWFRMCRWC